MEDQSRCFREIFIPEGCDSDAVPIYLKQPVFETDTPTSVTKNGSIAQFWGVFQCLIE